MAEPANHTLAYLRRLDDKLDRLHSDFDEKLDRLHSDIGGRLGRIEDELLVLNGIVLRLEGRKV